MAVSIKTSDNEALVVIGKLDAREQIMTDKEIMEMNLDFGVLAKSLSIEELNALYSEGGKSEKERFDILRTKTEELINNLYSLGFKKEIDEVYRNMLMH
jgi:hypothetical protein